MTQLDNLFHLNGMEVAIFADGNVIAPQVVTDNKITLSSPAYVVRVGLRYDCVARNLPLNTTQGVIEGKRRRVPALAVRLTDSRGLQVGMRLDKLYDMKERTNENWNQPTRLQDGSKYILIEPEWDTNGQCYFVQKHPLPATILGLVYDLEIGDDND